MHYPMNRGDVSAHVIWSCPHCEAVCEIRCDVNGMLVRMVKGERAKFVTSEIGACVESLDAEMQQHMADKHPETQKEDA